MCFLVSTLSFFFFFFKQKTAYEMRISDWSSDVCSSDLPGADVQALARLVHVDDAAGEVEGVGPLVHEHDIRPLGDDLAQRAERAVVIHRHVVVLQPRPHLGAVAVPLLADLGGRSEERRVGQECVSTCRSRWWADL